VRRGHLGWTKKRFAANCAFPVRGGLPTWLITSKGRMWYLPRMGVHRTTSSTARWWYRVFPVHGGSPIGRSLSSCATMCRSRTRGLTGVRNKGKIIETVSSLYAGVHRRPSAAGSRCRGVFPVRGVHLSRTAANRRWTNIFPVGRVSIFSDETEPIVVRCLPRARGFTLLGDVG
jgi:hypothetical protein